MRVKMFLPPLGPATLAGYLPPDTEVSNHDEHARRLDLDDDDPPDLVVIQVHNHTAAEVDAVTV